MENIYPPNTGIDLPPHPDTGGRPEKLILEKVRLGCQQYITGDLIREVESSADEKRIRLFYDQMIDSLCVQLKTFILGEKVHEETRTVPFRFPKSWWQHFKQDVFPQWLLKRFPVQMKAHHRKVTFNQVEAIPKFNQVLPPEQQEYHFTTFSSELDFAPQHD